MMNCAMSSSQPNFQFPMQQGGTAAVRLRAADPAVNGGNKTAILVDAALDDRQMLFAGAPAGNEVVEFGGTHDGLAQLVDWAATGEGYCALHLLCHGGPGRLQLGARTLDRAALADQDVRDALAAIGLSLRADGSVLLYGCHVAQGAGGEAFVAELAGALGVPVAASAGAVGAATLGGAWRLQHASDVVTAGTLAWPGYAHTLTIASNTTTFSTIAATYYQQQARGYDPSTVILAQADVASTGWDVETKSTNSESSFGIRGYNGTGYGADDGTSLRFIATDIDYVVFRSNAKGFYFDLTQFSLRNNVNADFQLQALDINGNAKGSAVSFSLTGTSLDGGAFSQFNVGGNADFEQIYGFKLTFSTANDAPFFDNVIVENIVVPSAAPTTTVTSAALSADTGPDSTDFITNSAAQTVAGYLSANLASGEKVEVSYDNGLHWSDANFTVGRNDWSASTTLSGSDTFQARVTNSGGSSTAFTHAYSLDTSAPAAPSLALAPDSDSGISSSDSITNVATPVFKGSSEAGATVILVDSDGATVVGSTVAGSDGKWSVATTALAEGAHTITAKATDLAGNISAASAGAAVNINLTAPVAQVNAAALSQDTGASATDMVTAQAAQTIGGTLSASLGADERVEVSLDNGTNWTTAATAAGASAWSLDVTLAGADTLQVRVIDAAGNAGAVYKHAYVLDTVAPEAPSMPDMDDASDTGTSHSDDITGNTTPSFSGLAENGATVILYDGARAIGSSVVADGVWHITSSALAAGSHSIVARATDLAGNVSAASDILKIQVVTDAPTTGIKSLALAADSGGSATDFITNTAAQTIAGRLDAGLADGERVEVSLDGGVHWTTASADGDAWSLGGITLAAGTSTIAVRVANAVDNAGPVYLQDVTLDTVAPTLSIASDVARLKAGQSATITFTFSEDPGMSFHWDGNGNGGSVVVSGGTLSALSGDGPVRTAVFTPDADTNGGSASITVPAGSYQDLAGNAGSAGASPALSFDTLAPAAPSAPLLAAGSDTGISASDNLTANERPTFSGSAESGTTVILRDADGSVIGSGIAVDGAWSIVPSARLAQGAHAISASAVDSAGNASAASGALNLVIDSVAPTLTIKSNIAYPKAGDTPLITFTFSEDPGKTFNAHDISVEGGTLSELSSIGAVRTAVFTPQDGVDGGVASIRVEAGAYTDAAGNAGGAGSVALVYDTQAPAAPSVPDLDDASDSGTSDTDNITGNTTPTFNGSAEIGATVHLYDGKTKIGSAVATYGLWSITSTTLSAGSHDIVAIATDAAGNVGPASEALTITVVTDGPTTAVSTVLFSADGGASSTDFVTNVAPQNLSGTLGAPLAKSEFVEVSVDGGKHWITASADGQAWSLPVLLAQGANAIEVRVTDAVGNSGPVHTQAYILDTVAPSVAITSDRAQLKVGETAAITFTFSEDPGASFAWDGKAGSLAVSGGTLSALSGSGLVRVATFTPAAGVDGGVAGITVASGAYADAAGNGGAAASMPPLHFDTLAPGAPSAPVLDPGSDSGIAGDGITANNAPLITGKADPYNSVTLVDSDGVTVLGNAIADVHGTWRIASSTLGDGVHTLSARQVDAAGNVSAAGAPLALTIDSTVPAGVAAPRLDAASDSGTVGDGITSVTKPVFTGTAEALAQVTLYDSDGLTVLGTAQAGADGKWRIASTTLAEGKHVVSARQVDSAGNVSGAGAGFEVTIDSKAPGAPAAPTLKASSDTGTLGDGITENANPVFEGSAEPFALVKLVDTGSGKLLGSATAAPDGKWSIAVTGLALGTHAISATQVDEAGNVSAASAVFTLRIDAPAATTPASTLVDGVQVTTQAVTVPGGASGTAVQVPIVTADRAESSGQAGVADIPLATSNGANLLVAQLATGYGLNASGANVAVANGLEHLISAIMAATPRHDAADQGHLTGNGKSYLATLASEGSLLVETVTPVSTAGASGTLTLSGSSAPAGQNVALVIDASGVAAGTTLALQGVNFAAVIGSANVVAQSGAPVLSGDAAAQHFTVEASGSSMVFAGGGNDTLSFGLPKAKATASTDPAAGQAHAAAVPATGVVLLHGGQGTDAATFDGARADFNIESHNGYLVVSSKAAPDAKALVVNVEQLQFSDGSFAVQNASDLTTLAGLYQTVLGRQADLGGFAFWADQQLGGASWGAVAIDMIGSNERAIATHNGFNGNATHDVTLLYEALFNRAPESAGLAYWTGQIEHGTSLETVASCMVQSIEMVGHQRASVDWDFSV